MDNVRHIKRTCCICKERAAILKQTYNAWLSRWEDSEAPICDECKRKEKD